MIFEEINNVCFKGMKAIGQAIEKFLLYLKNMENIHLKRESQLYRFKA